MALQKGLGGAQSGYCYCTMSTCCKNPATREAFAFAIITKVVKTVPYDVNLAERWACIGPYQNTAMSKAPIDSALAWAREIQRLGKSQTWWLNNCIWIDQCNTVIPAAKRTAFDQQQKAMGKHKKLISSDARQCSKYLKAVAYAGKKNGQTKGNCGV